MSAICKKPVKKTSHFKHDSHDIDISVITNKQETLRNKSFYKKYNTYDTAIWHVNVSYMYATLHTFELRLVKGLCQKYTAILGCHSNFY